MVYTAVIVTVLEMQFMAGENVDATGDVEANHTVLQNYAEGYLSALINDDVAANFSGYNSETKQMISEWAARMAGNALIKFNMAGYTDRVEAENMVNMNLFRMAQIEKLLEKGRTKTTLGK